ncbi:unnamed protein product [Nippostrongylus brasiliensis]|uniref:Exonuclease domain-containing protein n=1 Tax=Nippostrongylus brasiliensis TaxID=27835 RepID=A0A0N4YGJ6_NIPBR|nr:unnamed protein product [Nippostrongylus brasiliensis]
MAESDDSFGDEPVLYARADQEPETQPLDFGDQSMDDGRASPFIEQVPENSQPHSLRVHEPPTTPSKMVQFASKMGMISSVVKAPIMEPSVPTVVRDQLPTSSVKRSAAITLSPCKRIKRKGFGCDEAIRTFVFMDFETTGRIEGNNDNEFRKFESKLHEPGNYSNMLTKLIVESINLERQDLILKGTFAQEWPGVRAFLETCKKPACLVAHNGLAFDYRVLFGELTRCGFIDADMGIPDGVVFVDSYLAIRELEEKHRAELQQATKLVDWKMLSDHVLLNRVAACEDIPAAVEEASDVVELRHDNLVTPREHQFPNDPRTPVHRPPPPRSTRSEPTKLSSRRRLFGEELPVNDHPLLFLNTEEWSPAKRRRIRPEFFKRIDGGRWDFNRSIAQMNTRNKLTTIYETVLKAEYDAHYAQDDTEALIQVCLAYGKEFVDYADSKAADFPY